MTFLIVASTILLCLLNTEETTGQEGVQEINISNLSTSQFATLSCNLGSWIHVRNLIYRSAGYEVQLSTRNISALCVGKELCLYQNAFRSSNGSINIQYECIFNNRFGLCDQDVQGADYTDPINLHSHSYPVSLAINRTCACVVRGRNMTVTAFHLNLTNPRAYFGVNENDSNFTIPDRQLFDYVLAERQDVVTVSYTDGGQNGQQVWINIAATDRMIVSCLRTPPLPFVPTIDQTTTQSSPRTSTVTTVTMTSRGSTSSTPISSFVTTAQPSVAGTTVAPSSDMTRVMTVTTPTAPASVTSGEISTLQPNPTIPETDSTTLETDSTTPETDSMIPTHLDLKLVVAAIIAGSLFFVGIVILIVVCLCLRHRRLYRSQMRIKANPTHFQAPPRSPVSIGTYPDYLHLVNTNNTYSQLVTERSSQAVTHEYTELHVYETFSEK